MKTTVIFHSADMDGIFCREIARKFLPDAELIGWDWRDKPIPFPSEGDVYVLDLSPDCFESVPKHQERLIWIDHHKSAIDKFPKVLPGYRIDGVAACRLAWQWFLHHQPQSGSLGPLPHKDAFVNRMVPEPVAVRLAGEYDIWDKRDPNAEIFQFGLRSRELTESDWHYMLLMKTDLSITPDVTAELLENGVMLQSYQQRNDAGTMARSFLIKFEGLNFLALNTARCNSLTFASKDVPETGHDALMGFYFDGAKWNVSLYHANHRKDLDLSLIAVKYGGGGHRGACGFATRNLPGVSNLPFISA